MSDPTRLAAALSLASVIASCGARSELRVQHGFVEIAVADRHACGLRDDGRVSCWGSNTVGQLGDGSFVNRSTPVDVQGVNDAVDLAVGTPCLVAEIFPPGISNVETDEVGFGCIVRRSGRVSCWGSNALAELGVPSSTPHPTPIDVAGLTGATSISCNGVACCVIRTDGGVSCWGHGRTSGPASTSRWGSAPVAIPGIEHAEHIAVGGEHACAIVAGGRVFCWGSNDGGELGDGTTFGDVGPRLVRGITDPTSIIAFSVYTFVRSRDGHWTGWPMAAGGLPARIEIGATTAGVAMSCYAGAFASQDDGSVSTLVGSIGSLALGEPLAGLEGVIHAAAAGEFACFLKGDGSAWCRGNNAFGQLGDGTTTSSAEPVRVMQ